jgi:hypothetical protein
VAEDAHHGRREDEQRAEDAAHDEERAAVLIIRNCRRVAVVEGIAARSGTLVAVVAAVFSATVVVLL